MIDLDHVHKIYFIGIGGIGMSATAGICKQKNFEVLGSDSAAVYPPARDVLTENEIDFFEGYSLNNISSVKADLYVVSSGETLDNPEVKFVYDHQLPHASFAELLYELSRDQLRVVVAGTNGKSTTTGLLGHVLKNLDDSSFMTGAVLQNYGSNYHLGDGHYFVFEGDEYKAEFDDPTPKFHYYKPDILLLTNLEYDHPDMFENMEALEREFLELIENMPEDGLIIYNADDGNLAKLVHQSNVSAVSFGIDNPADYKVEQLVFDSQATTMEILNKFSKNVSSALLGQTEQYKIQLPGKINAYNALAVIATLRALGFSQEDIALDLLSFQGLKRRFEVVGVKNGITLVDDYAHHPTAVRETLAAARLKYFPAPVSQPPNSNPQSPTSKLWAVFEPHTFSRTQATLHDLAKSFDEADEVLISEIYPAREKKYESTITSQAVVQTLGPHHKHVRLVHSKDEALNILKTETKPGDIVLVMAVGSFNRLAYELLDMI